MSIKIYFDLDGVLADFDAKIVELGLKTNVQMQAAAASEEEYRKINTARWRKIEQVADFWPNLAEMPGARKILTYAATRGELHILSKTPGPWHFDDAPAYIQSVVTDKTEWTRRHFPEFFSAENITIATGAKNRFVGEIDGNILIDDIQDNIEKWNAAGGIGILYLNADQVIEELRNKE